MKILNMKAFSDYLEAEYSLSQEAIGILIQAVELGMLTPKEIDIIVESYKNQ